MRIWPLENADKPANINEQDSETPWLTREAIKFLDNVEKPWCAHVSYIKPHWPYIVPAPYHNMYNKDDVQKIIRDVRETKKPNPVIEAIFNNKIAKTNEAWIVLDNDDSKLPIIKLIIH